MKIVKGIIIPVIVAIILGFVLGKYVFKMYRNNLYSELTSSKLYLLENGEYDDIDTMREENNVNNYIYYKDNNKYKTIVGITKNYNNINIIKKLYSDNLKVHEYYVSNDLVNNRQDEYDNNLMHAKDINEVKEVVDSILKLYKDDDNIKLIQIN